MAERGVPKPPRPTPHPTSPKNVGAYAGTAPPTYRCYGVLRDEVPEEDREWDLEGDDGDPMETFGITPPRGERRDAASRSRRVREADEYMDTVC